MPTFPEKLLPSADYPLGAYADGRGIHFAVFSEAAERMQLCLFDSTGRHELSRHDVPDCTNGVWHGYLPGARAGQLYGYRAYGAYEPKHGKRFNPHKLLLDPCARQLAGEIKWHDALYGYRIGSPKGDLSFDRRDSAAYMPKAVVAEEFFEWGDDRPPRIPWADTIIYELHVKGFTQLRTDIPPQDRGTFAALGHPACVSYLQDLGITAVELLPVQGFVSDRHLTDRKLTNYWGYNTLAFFAPHQQYLSDSTLSQMKWAIRQLHAAGIEVILDVVYNHTGEGSELGPTLCFRGLDNESYYRLTPDNKRYYINDTGCGNTLNFSSRRVIQLVMDSLRYWVREFHVDGFRFDLGVTLGREHYGFDPSSGFFDALLQDPLLARVKLISEPWDIGPGGFQVGNHPAGMAEWNGLFRDDVRRYWKGDEAMRGAIAGRLQGSADLFDSGGRRPWSSVNFVTVHDGFTLNDLVSFSEKHNEANGENGEDGGSHNHSHNWGYEGPSEDDVINFQRDKIIRNFITTLLASHGTPLLLAGDEFGNSQHGNNNTYCQDNETSWLDWSSLDTARGADLHAFVKGMIGVRKSNLLYRCERYQCADDIIPGLKALYWFDERGIELTEADWGNASARLLGLRRARVDKDSGRIALVVLLANADVNAHTFVLPEPRVSFRVVVSTSVSIGVEDLLAEGSCEVDAHSLVICEGWYEPRSAES